MKNKEKIIVSATRLFNENGFVNVRLQHISDDTIISVGNIAYHFRNKEAIVNEIFVSLEKELRAALIEYRNTPIFENVERVFSSVQAVQEQYSFFFTDIVEIKRSHPDLFEKLQALFQWQVFMFQEILRFNHSRGALISLSENATSFLALHIIQTLNAWPALVLGLDQKDDTPKHSLSEYLWQILHAYMTESGKEEYQVMRDQMIKY